MASTESIFPARPGPQGVLKEKMCQKVGAEITTKNFSQRICRLIFVYLLSSLKLFYAELAPLWTKIDAFLHTKTSFRKIHTVQTSNVKTISHQLLLINPLNFVFQLNYNHLKRQIERNKDLTTKYSLPCLSVVI